MCTRSVRLDLYGTADKYVAAFRASADKAVAGEQLYRSVASTFIVAPQVAWADDRRGDALRSQLPLEHLVRLGETLQRDATGLLDRAAFDGDEIAAAAVEATAHFADEAARAAFLDEFLAALKPLLKKYGARKGDPYRVALAVYPDTSEAD